MNVLGCLDRPTRGPVHPGRHGRRPTSTTTGSPASAAAPSASCSSPTTCCRARRALDNVATPLLYQGVAAAEREGRARARPSSASAWATASTTSRRSCRAASSSAWPSPAPSSPTRRSSSPTSPPATSTRTPGRRSWPCCVPSTRPAARSCSSPTTPRSPRMATRQVHIARRDGGGMRVVDLVAARLRRACGTSRLRTVLTMLGVIIGVGLGGRARRRWARAPPSDITARLSSLGTNLLTVNPGSTEQRRHACGPRVGHDAHGRGRDGAAGRRPASLAWHPRCPRAGWSSRATKNTTTVDRGHRRPTTRRCATSPCGRARS